jgi:casein kinase 1
MIDFGLATFFIDEHSIHLPNEPIQTIIGSPRWISIRILEGNRYSRRDDLISIGYIYCSFFLKHTPWEPDNIIFNNGETSHNILDIDNPINILRKERRTIDLFKKILPIDSNIMKYLEIVYMYEYTDKPNYNELIELFS